MNIVAGWLTHQALHHLQHHTTSDVAQPDPIGDLKTIHPDE